MKTELHYYDIFPKVIVENKPVEICIKPLGVQADFTDAKYRISIRPFNEGTNCDYPDRPNNVWLETEVCSDGCIRFNYTFTGEQEHYIRVYALNEDERIVNLAVYSIKSDLADRYPFSGDLHMHTCRSDGKEDPRLVCANYRKFGYDFLAITDHRRYYPSLDAMAAFKDVPIEMTLIPGEEVHMPKLDKPHINDVHIVSFGCDYSINALAESSEHCLEVGTAKDRRSIDPANCPETMSDEEFWRQVDATIDSLNIPDGIEKGTYACCKWIFDKIREGHGLGIFAHPYWISDVFQVPETLVEYMMEQQPFDAFEVLGGERNFEQNGFQTQRFYEDRAKGRNYPIVGSTDSHSSVNNIMGYICHTIVFAPENEKTSLIKAIKDKYTVAVDTISKEYRLVGDTRFVRYGCFLLEEFFPLHDELCFEEGRAMRDYAFGEDGAKDILCLISGRMKKQREKYFSF